MSENIKELVVTSVFVTLFVFIAHMLPINENTIEKKIINAKNKQDKYIGYGIAFMYYVLLIFIGLYFSKDYINKISKL
jgi:hypothetical protein